MKRMTFMLTFVAGILLCLGLWLAVPYNNFALNNSFVSDGYLPEIVLICLVAVVLLINPLLRRFLPGHAISREQLLLITGMLLFAAILPSNGLYRFFPHCLAHDTELINQSPDVAEAIQTSDLPPALFPDPIKAGGKTPVSSQLLDELEPGESIPWKAWGPPLVAWGSLVLAFWVVMVGLGVTVYPQWRYNERLVFPLLEVYHSILDEPERGKLLPPLFRSKLFWISCGTVLLLHSFNGLALMTDNAWPKFPLSWNLSNAFASGVWQYAPGFLKHSRIYFVFIGLAYFMPNRYSFSIWFTILFFGIFVMFTRQYMPTFDTPRLYDQGSGALLAIAAGIFWLGRQHYARVLKATFSMRNPDDDEKTKALGGRLFVGGAVFMLAWFIWAGAGVLWSLLFLVLGIVIMLLVARIVAETGITYVWIIPLTASRIVDLFPRSWSSISTAFLQQAHYILANRASAVSAAAMMILTLGLRRKYNPRTSRRTAGIVLLVLCLGLLICGAVHLHMGYNLASSYDSVQSPITGRGARVMGLAPVTNLVLGRQNRDRAAQIQFILQGAALAGGLLFLCARFPRWPLHPIGLIFVHSSIGLRLFMSLFIGWALRGLIIRYFGAGAYRTAKPAFLGFILGEVLANALWTLIPVLGLFFGASPGEIEHIIIFQYT